MKERKAKLATKRVKDCKEITPRRKMVALKSIEKFKPAKRKWI